MSTCRTAIGKRRRDNGEGFLRERVYGLGHGGEVVERILRPGANRHQRLAGSPGIPVICFDEIKRVGDQTGGVHSFNSRDIIEGCDHRTVFRRPGHRTLPQAAITLHALRKSP